jgi:hypothetical protein
MLPCSISFIIVCIVVVISYSLRHGVHCFYGNNMDDRDNTQVKTNSPTSYPSFSLRDARHRQFFIHGAIATSGPGLPHYRGFTITLRHTTLGRTPLDEWSSWRRDLYLTTHNTRKRQTSISPAGFEPTIPASERSHTHALTALPLRHR